MTQIDLNKKKKREQTDWKEKTAQNVGGAQLDKYRIQQIQVATTHLESIVGPRAKLENTRLFVEGKVLDVDFATRFVDGRRFPFDETSVVHGRFGRQSHLKVTVRAASKQRHTTLICDALL